MITYEWRQAEGGISTDWFLVNPADGSIRSKVFMQRDGVFAASQWTGGGPWISLEDAKACVFSLYKNIEERQEQELLDMRERIKHQFTGCSDSRQ